MGSAASAPIKRQAKALKGRRYMRGMRPEKYFEVVVKPEHGELFDILDFSEEEAFEIFVQFISVDDDNSGEVSVGEFHRHLDSQATKFSERVFAILDQDMSGKLDLREFVVGVWNYCTYDTVLVAKLLFDIFDVDRRGKVTVPELDAMLRMLYASQDADPELIKLLAVNGSADEDELSFEEFLAVVEDNYQVVQPAFELQQAIRRKVLGVRYWEKMARQRKKMFASYDQGDMTSWQAVEAIVTAKHKERLAEAARKRAEVEARHDHELQQAGEEQRALHETNQLRKINKLKELRDARETEEVEEERAWKELKEAQAIASTDYTEDKVEELRVARGVLWDSYERAVASSKARAEKKAAKDFELASNDDATSKAAAWILTKQGSVKYDFLCRQAYGNLLHEEYVRRGPPMKAFAALHTSDDGPVTLATSIAYKNPRPTLLKAAKATAKQNIVTRFAKQETALAAERAAKETAQQQLDFEALHRQLVAEVGQRSTAWDLLWNPKKEDQYHLHVEELGFARRYPKDTAICDKCDAMIPAEDRVCPQCHAERTAKNQKLYAGFKL